MKDWKKLTEVSGNKQNDLFWSRKLNIDLIPFFSFFDLTFAAELGLQWNIK